MKIIELTVIADKNCPTSRTYLIYLASIGYRVRKVLLVNFLWKVPEAFRYWSWLGPHVRSAITQKQKASEPQFSTEFKKLCDILQDHVEIPIDYFSTFDYSKYAEEVEATTAINFLDEDFHKKLLKQQTKTFLYTNGGRVPGVLLKNHELTFIHVHPGVLPDVRGSDGLFWSILVRGRPGASCFYMDEGIDEGKIIHSKEFRVPSLIGLCSGAEDRYSLLYHALLFAYDPHLRGMVLRDVMQNAAIGDLSKLRAEPQDFSLGKTYTSMHEGLRNKVIEKISSCASGKTVD
ncbi:formyltransferase family protein [Alphaproteobacteria bacterium]|nr:formyltransferase family protein [Alphaproteobacteria bacterium]